MKLLFPLSVSRNRPSTIELVLESTARGSMILLLLWLLLIYIPNGKILTMRQERNNLLAYFSRKMRLMSTATKVLVLVMMESIAGCALTMVNALYMASQIGHLVGTVRTVRAPERSLPSMHNNVSLIQLLASWPSEGLGAVWAREAGRSTHTPTTTTTTAAALLMWGSSTLQDTRQL